METTGAIESDRGLMTFTLPVVGPLTFRPFDPVAGIGQAFSRYSRLQSVADLPLQILTPPLLADCALKAAGPRRLQSVLKPAIKYP